jgi:hypothetical protein
MPQSSEVDLPPTAPADPRLAAFCLLSQFRGDVAGKLASQQTGEFQLVQNGDVVAFQADRSLLATEQLSDVEILRLSRQ